MGRLAVSTGLFLGAMLCGSVVHGSANPTTATLHSIRMVTVSSADASAAARRYVRHLGYNPVEHGTITADFAAAWRAPAMTGRSYTVLRSRDPEPVFLRFVETTSPQAPYLPVSTAGWNALELLVRDPYEAHRHLADSPFEHLAGPAPLTDGSSIHAAQYLGPDGEVLYLTADLERGHTSTLARTEHRVGRPFIVVLAGADIDALSRFYAGTFGLQEAFRAQLPIPFIATAQKREPSHRYTLALLRLDRFSHSIEIDQYPAAPARARVAGELPPGISVVTFCGTFSHAPRSLGSRNIATPGMAREFRTVSQAPGIAYAGRSVSFLNGAADELIEVLSCEPPSAPARGPPPNRTYKNNIITFR